MFTRTENGYALNGWEAVPSELPTGAKLTVRECQAVLCRLAGMSAKEAALQMGCGAKTIEDRWSTIYYKLHLQSGDVVVAITQLLESGVVHRLALAALSVFILGASVSIDGDRDMDARVVRTARGTRRNETDGLPIELLPVLDGRYA